MKKFVIVFSVLLAFLMTSESTAQYVKKWEKTFATTSFLNGAGLTRSLTLNPVNDHLYISTRVGGNNIWILDWATGDTLGRFKTASSVISGGLIAFNNIKCDSLGVTYVASVGGAGGAFSIYRFASETDTATLAFRGNLLNRTGDAFTVRGSGTNTIIYASGSLSNKIYIFTTVNGENFLLSDSITVPISQMARGGIYPEYTGRTSPLWVNQAGSNVYRITSTGTITDTIDGGVVSGGWHNVNYKESITGDKYITVVGKNDATNNSAMMVNITKSIKFPKVENNFKLTNTWVANGNGTGDVYIKEVKRGIFEIVVLHTENGVALFRSNNLPIAWAKEDLDKNNIPDRLGDTVTVVGTNFSPSYSSTSYYIWDGTGSVNLFKAGSATDTALKVGDKVQVLGKVAQFRGLTEIEAFADSTIIVLSDSNALPKPTVLTLKNYKDSSEVYEGELIGFMNLVVTAASPWAAVGADANALVTDGTDTIVARIDKDAAVDGMVKPTGQFDLIGIGNQFASTGVVGGIQLLLRDSTDFLPAGTLPVELTSLRASVGNGAVSIEWTTATETNNMGFEVERAEKGSDFTRIAFVKGSGTSTNINNYSYNDASIVAGSEYSYRLKQIDFDGTYAYSKVLDVKTEMPRIYNLSQNYPNPFNPSTTISFSLPVDSKVSVKIFNVLGSEVMQLTNSDMTAGNHSLNFSMKNISSGIYFYTLEAQGIDGTKFVSSKKMTLLK